VRLAYDLVYGTSGSADITVRVHGYVFHGDRFTFNATCTVIDEIIYDESFTADGSDIVTLDVARFDAIRVSTQATSVAATTATAFSAALEVWTE
jgi:hypothetical protein